ncbi:glycoside hydrolase family 3 C-terminal domain-containing protein [Mucilaginibacter sp. RS28]|uniref:Glycoside hydrolase family 3 C-terminal domain-containing protein n=1 Tax=Mucilaginibacter straminoryzae TaxID=2932774 RepID=A0A9X2B8P5_9SPHI|nr:glycoside hydrolase family 3 N-terminal domain-containing protein [Mucilaginibacter straminoryzae]MCJ8209834.1 glycoside hydrolase family 3 C-terminal domain-containing protein [Mucilaginibacter straminoryzae]
MRVLFKTLLLTIVVSITKSAVAQETYLNANLSPEVRADDLLKKLTLQEKALLLGYRSKAIDRLHIPAYNWWNEGLHGVARAGEATVFPQAIAMAATFNPSLVTEIGTAISTEARAKHNAAVARGDRGMYVGLTYWSPNINIFRDPRWGRGQETYGEDPYLTSRIGLAYVKGMQGDIEGKFKIAATAKHFVAHSGPEATRDYFNAKVTEKDLRETYLYAFNKLVKGGVSSVMTAYNSVNGVPNSVNASLLRSIVMKEWGFKGYIVTDCGALDDVFATHKYLKNGTEAAAAAIKAGINLDCSSVLQDDVVNAVNQKLITEKDVNAALRPLLLTQLKLGFFDDPKQSPYYNYGADSIHNQQHIALARKAAQQSMVLLKNENNILPLKDGSFNSIMVVGPNAASLDALVGSYHGINSQMVTFVEGISGAVSKGTRVEYDLGAGEADTTHFGGIWGAGNADVTVAVVGLLPVTEGEAGDAFLSAAGGDKKTLSLPASHIKFMKELRKGVKKPIIAVITSGSAVDVAEVAKYADAVILAWYPGEQGGNALADILLGKVSPSGKLPLTFYNSVNDLPAFDNYSMQGRTYRYFNGKVQYPFGFGLSYTNFAYTWQNQPKTTYAAKDSITFTVTIKNTGSMAGDEVVQVYIKYPGIGQMPLKELKGFKRVSVSQGGEQTVTISIPVTELQKWDSNKHGWQLYKGAYELQVGDNSADAKLQASFTIK